MKIALAQINPTVGALESNSLRILDFYRKAAEKGADLVIFPELALTGYPPKDLLDQPDFIKNSAHSLDELARNMTGPGSIIGYVQPRNPANDAGKTLYNAAALVEGGQIVSSHYKSLLPTYDVFDESRYFEPADQLRPAEFRGLKLGITICEDIWNTGIDESLPQRLYQRNPARELAKQGVDLMINIAASPYSLDKQHIKAGIYRAEATRHGVPLVQVNMVGGNDNLIFDGWSNVWNDKGRVVAQAARFEEDLLIWDSETQPAGTDPQTCDSEEILFAALRLGVHDYVHKCGFKKVLVGLSGGIDSALTAVIAADAIGPDHVLGISMPSQFSSDHSRDDARRLAEHLGIEYHEIPIESIYNAFMKELHPLFKDLEFGIAEENLQARTRGTLLMTLSNKFDRLVLTTGNKSELAVGYCTLYGDMNGGLSVLADVLKSRVYALSRWVNRDTERIPVSIIDKPPSAELRPGQLDSDSLPPYDHLDPIIEAYVVDLLSPGEIMKQGHDPALVRRIIRMIDNTEYKRQQAAVCLKVTCRAFGSGRRMPIARGT
jgi:NAD+ synthase (glutamine-hydrolysing)